MGWVDMRLRRFFLTRVGAISILMLSPISQILPTNAAQIATVDQAVLGHQVTTQQYIENFNLAAYENRGVDYFNPSFGLTRFSKPPEELDRTLDFDFQEVERLTAKFSTVNRVKVLKYIFSRITQGANTNVDKHRAILLFMHKVSFHNFVQPMYPDGQAVLDPVLLLEIGEMRCGQSARLSLDIASAGGMKGRLIQLANHVTAEIFYDNEWHLMETDLFGGGLTPIIDGSIPSYEKLASHPFEIDKYPNQEVYISGMYTCQKNCASYYPSHFYYNRGAFSVGDGPLYYYKTATPLESESSIYYGWNYWVTQKVQLKLEYLEKYLNPEPPKFEKLRLVKNRLNFILAPSNSAKGITYLVYVSREPRGWNAGVFASDSSIKHLWYTKYNSSMYDAAFSIPKHEVHYSETKSRLITVNLPSKGTYFLSVAMQDNHGLVTGRKVWPLSEELRIQN